MNHVSVEREIAGRTYRIETGKIAKLASAAVVVTYGETVILVSAMRSNPRPGLDFFPLQCDYREKLGAGGKFPGGFRKREGPPSEKEILTMRNMDRPIRPLFPDGFIDEVQIQGWVMSHDGQNDADILAMTGASAAVSLTDAPFEGPVATVRVGRIETKDGMQFVLNPTHAQLEFSDLDLLVCGHSDGVNMIEVGAAEVPDEDVLDAIKFGYEEGIKPLLELQQELMEKVGVTKNPGSPAVPAEDVVEAVKKAVEADLTEARKINGKSERNDAINELRSKMLEEHFKIPEGVPYS
ncbi:MAG: polyribonucleotide nucleotidyltransferase, partial [Planctomycetota bacterium]